MAVSEVASVVPVPARVANANELELPLQPVLEKLPADLQGKLTFPLAALGQASITIPVEQILPQLATGSVKISFGQLREAAPNLFRVGAEYDSLPVMLPLNAVLSRLNPTWLARQPEQKSVEVSEEVTGPFGARGSGVSFANTLLKSPAPANAPRAITPQAISRVPVAPPSATPPIRMVEPVTPVAKPRIPVSTPPPPFARPTPLAPSNGNGNGNGNGIHSHDELPPIPMIAPVPATPAPALTTPVVPPSSEPALLSVPLAALVENWPDALKKELVQLNLMSAQVALPADLIGAGLKRGRITMNWRSLRAFIQPMSPAVSVHDNVELELPLKVIAPLFLARQKPAARPQQRVAPVEEIPNLFFGFPHPDMEAPAAPLPAPLPAPVPAPVIAPVTPVAPPVYLPSPPPLKPVDAKLAETNYYIWGDDGSELPHVDASEYKRPQPPATDFTSRHATPQEIVARAMLLPGVAGAVVALPDGLRVASQVPPEMNAETLAAFLPQLFDRLGQITRELRMGQLNNLNFTVGNVPWKVFRVNSVYFAAFGRSSDSLPTTQLAGLAALLDRKKPQ
jgi:hypothetical protein